MPKNSTIGDREFSLWVTAHRILDMEGHTDMAQGHLSIRDPYGRGFWLKRTGISLGEVSGPDDFVLAGFDGRKLSGQGLHGEWPIHSEIFKQRPDVNAIGHTHPFYASVFSASLEPLRAVAHEGSNLRGPIQRYTVTSNLINTVSLGRGVADALGASQALMMKNHGVTFVGSSVEDCVLAGIFLEKACRAQLVIAASGIAWEYPNDKDLVEKYETVMTPSFLKNSWEFYVRKFVVLAGKRH